MRYWGTFSRRSLGTLKVALAEDKVICPGHHNLNSSQAWASSTKRRPNSACSTAMVKATVWPGWTLIPCFTKRWAYFSGFFLKFGKTMRFSFLLDIPYYCTIFRSLKVKNFPQMQEVSSIKTSIWLCEMLSFYQLFGRGFTLTKAKVHDLIRQTGNLISYQKPLHGHYPPYSLCQLLVLQCCQMVLELGVSSWLGCRIFSYLSVYQWVVVCTLRPIFFFSAKANQTA